ncbi:hypothetical protein DUNSADRAFT_7396, partial [Dunaliella salina]
MPLVQVKFMSSCALAECITGSIDSDGVDQALTDVWRLGLVSLCSVNCFYCFLQVVLSGAAWDKSKSILAGRPGATSIVSLGTHVLSQRLMPLTLTEVLPSLLADRSFPPISSLAQLAPGYRDAPSVDKPMSIVFTKVQKPEPVSRAEQMGTDADAASASAPMGDTELVANIVAYQVAVKKYTTVARRLLQAYGGYECK